MTDLAGALVRALQEQAARQRGFLSESMAKALAQVAMNTIQGSVSHGPTNSASGLASADDWQASGELRWYAEHVGSPVQLQQAWHRRGEGQVQWRAVPLVIGDHLGTIEAASPQP